MYMRFPGLKIHSHISTECLQCSQDEHMPKLYSSTNNMDPDPVPPLQASTCSYCILDEVTVALNYQFCIH